MLNLPSNPKPNPRAPHTLEAKRGHCRRCGILPETRGALLCNDCAVHAPIISYHQSMGAERFFQRVQVDFQRVGDDKDDSRSRYVCAKCCGPKGYHGKICRSCASRHNRGNPRLATRAASKEHLQ